MFREMTQAREWCTLHFPSMESRSGFGAFFHKKPIDSEPELEGAGHRPQHRRALRRLQRALRQRAAPTTCPRTTSSAASAAPT